VVWGLLRASSASRSAKTVSWGLLRVSSASRGVQTVAWGLLRAVVCQQKREDGEVGDA
jgi:hypothetical protein